MSQSSDIFGATRLGYALIETRALDDWKQFLQRGLGLHMAEHTSDSLAFRVDRHARRLILRDGPAEDFVALGWQVRDQATLRVILERLAAHDIAVEEGRADQAALRGVEAYWAFTGPKGLPIELFVEAVTSDAPLDMLSSGFVTGAGGMGHVALTSRQPELVRRFWQEIFDARISDRIEQPMAGVTLEIDFLRLNERHHSLAIAATRGLRMDPIRTRIQHLNLQVSTVEDLTRAYDRLREMGYTMAHQMGQHPNDRELSFYVLSPSGFEMELGWNPLTVDEASWDTRAYKGISNWGHESERSTVLQNLSNFKNGLASLLKSEYSPLS